MISTAMTRMLSTSTNHSCHRSGCGGGAFGNGSGGGPDFTVRDTFASQNKPLSVLATGTCLDGSALIPSPTEAIGPWHPGPSATANSDRSSGLQLCRQFGSLLVYPPPSAT